MGNVFDAMKKHEAEQGDRAPLAGPRPGAPGDAPPPEVRGPRRAAVSMNGYSPLMVAHHDRGSKRTEEYRALRTNLQAQYQDGRFCILVTSADPGEGKTVTCANLAVVLAERPEFRTLLVDCDLRRGKIASLFGIEKSPGMADLLRAQASLADVVRTTSHTNLFVIPCGRVEADDVGGLLGKPEVDEIIGKLRHDYDYVLLDTPPLNRVSDAGILGRATHEALLVVRMYKTHRESVDKAVRLLHAANVKPVGVVLTHQQYYIPSYLYRYS